MGIIKAIGSAIGGGFADSWLEVIEPQQMGDTTVFASGVKVRGGDRRNQNRKGTADTVSNGSIIHVYPNQFMMLVDGGKVIDYTAEEGYYEVKDSSLPSLFNGQFGDSLKETFSRIKYAGVTPTAQKVYYVNLQEIKGIKFGTKNPINYFDNFYNAELFLRTHGTYSIKITNPLLFYREAIPRDAELVDIEDINEQYLSEFLEALQSAVNQMSADGIRISFVPSKGRELSRYMSEILDEDWKKMRGMEVQSVGIASISYNEESEDLIHMRNQGAMLGDPSIREGYVQGAAARGIEAAGSNANGAMAGFMGVGVGMQNAGSFVGAASQANQAAADRMAAQKEKEKPEEEEWKCSCGAVETGKFCSQCGKPRPAGESWTCSCGAVNRGNFCSECGKPRPKNQAFHCEKCGYTAPVSGQTPKFCPNCGAPVQSDTE